MKKILWISIVLLVVGRSGFCDTSTIQVKLTTSTPKIFVGEAIMATVEVTNLGTDLQLPRSDMAEFSELFSPDSPNLWFSGGVSITSINGEVPTMILKQGEKISTNLSLSGKTHDKSPITFRIGFKTSEDSPVVWSNPVTVSFKEDEPLSMKMETILKEGTIDISNVKTPRSASAHLLITNTTGTSQSLGLTRGCCLEELQNLMSDNPDIKVETAVQGYMKCSCPIHEVTLAPRKVFEQDFQMNYWGHDPNPGPITFRVGIKTLGHLPVWGNSLTVNVVGGSAEWSKHIDYVKNRIKEESKETHPDGVHKTYFESGSLMEEATYKNGKLNGPLKRYYENGSLSEIINYVDGKQNGQKYDYFKDGKLKMQTLMHNNEVVSYIAYNQDGSVYSHMKYMQEVNGKLIQKMCREADDHNPAAANEPYCDDVLPKM
jgi:hypothetical protein